MLTNNILNTVFLPSHCYVFLPYEKLQVPVSDGGFQELRLWGPWALDRQGEKQISVLPAEVDFSAMASRSPLRQLTLWGPWNFFSPKHVDSLNSCGMWLPLSVCEDSQGWLGSMLFQVPQVYISPAPSPQCCPAAGLWGKSTGHCQLTRNTTKRGAQVFQITWCHLFQDSLKRGCYPSEPLNDPINRSGRICFLKTLRFRTKFRVII